MKNKILVLLTLIVLSSNFAFAQSQEEFIIDTTYDNTYTGKNPFEPQLPEVKPEPPPDISNRTTSTTRNVTPQPPPKPPVIFPNLVINGVIWNTDRPQAIINNQVVDEGDNIEGLTIVKIRKNEIEVSLEGVAKKYVP